MKKALAGLIILAIIAGAVYLLTPGEKNEDYIRIHIRANSNSEADQSIKLVVRDAVVNYLTPLLAQAETTEKAKKVLKANLKELENIARNILAENGFGYGAEAVFRMEEFPARSYGSLTLDKGFYDALIIELGSAAGDNWWCVAFPPLCFVPSEGKNIKYKSKIMEIIENAKRKTV